MAAIIDFILKRGFSQGGFGWGFMCCFKYFNRVKLCWETFVNIFVN